MFTMLAEILRFIEEWSYSSFLQRDATDIPRLPRKIILFEKKLSIVEILFTP